MAVALACGAEVSGRAGDTGRAGDVGTGAAAVGGSFGEARFVRGCCAPGPEFPCSLRMASGMRAAQKQCCAIFQPSSLKVALVSSSVALEHCGARPAVIKMSTT